MVSPETLRELGLVAERFGWPVLLIAVGVWVSIKSGRAVANGICYAWERVEPYVTGLLGSHSDLMDTAKEQMPKQTAILQELSQGQRHHSDLLSSIHTTVKDLRRSDPNVEVQSEKES